MNGVSGHDSALLRLYWAGDNLDESVYRPTSCRASKSILFCYCSRPDRHRHLGDRRVYRTALCCVHEVPGSGSGAWRGDGKKLQGRWHLLGDCGEKYRDIHPEYLRHYVLPTTGCHHISSCEGKKKDNLFCNKINEMIGVLGHDFSAL